MNGRPRLVLVVDDNEVNLKLARVALQSEGLEVATACGAEEALAAVAARKPGVILMDVQLPGVDGLTLTRRLKADPATRDIAIVAVTAYAMKGDERKALDAGCDAYVSKPIDTRALPKLVAELLERGPAAPKAALILVVEDDASFGKLLRVWMAGAGFRVTLAADLAAARAAAAAETPDLVITDRHVKPSGDGLEYCRELKSTPATAAVPVILLTGSEQADVVYEPRADGPDLYLLKTPEVLAGLQEHVRSLLARRR